MADWKKPRIYFKNDDGYEMEVFVQDCALRFYFALYCHNVLAELVPTT